MENKKMKLHDVPRSSIIDVSEHELRFEDTDKKITTCFFEGIDGMIGNCIEDGKRFQLFATTEVILVDANPAGYYNGEVLTKKYTIKKTKERRTFFSKWW